MSELKRELFPRRRRPRSESGDVVDHPKSKGRRRKKRKQKGKRRLTLAVLPTMLTLGNAVCGMAAIAVVISVHLEWPDEQKFLVAGVFIFAGMLFDALDGSAARMTGQASKFGAELDSLCDAITFGTAPAVLVWRISSTMAPSRLSWGIGVLFTLCVLIRLARFNVETEDDDLHEGFEGLPSPAAAGTLAAFAIAIQELNRISGDENYFDSIRYVADKSLQAAPVFVPALAALLAYLMVSRFQYPHVMQQLVRGRWSFHQIGQAIFAVIGIIVLHELALPIALCIFAFSSPIRSLLTPRSTQDSLAQDKSAQADPGVAVEKPVGQEPAREATADETPANVAQVLEPSEDSD